MKRLSVVLMVLAALVFFSACNEESAPIVGNDAESFSSEGEALVLEGGSTALFNVTITNLAPATGPGASQPLSPPVVATHTKKSFIFRTGTRASHELGQLAEDAVSDPLIALLNGDSRFHDVSAGTGVILPGDSASITVEAATGFTHLSLVSMLVNTNDAFAGLNRLRLNKHGSTTVYINTYDAGTEVNTELMDHIPGPCCGNPLVRVPDNAKVSLHPGITGVGDLDPAVYGWTDPVAKVTITRIP